MTPDYETPIRATTTSNHDHVYTTILGVLAFFVVIGMVTLNALRNRPGIDPDAKAALLLPLSVEGCFLAAVVLILAIRLVFPPHRRWPTLGLNIALLLFFPLGTALGIYGLMKVDKQRA